MLIRHEETVISVPALRVIGNILSSPNSEITSVPVDAGALQILFECINHPKQVMRKEATWSVANVTAESAERIHQCIDTGIIQALIQHLQHDSNMIRRECVWALTNALHSANPA